MKRPKLYPGDRVGIVQKYSRWLLEGFVVVSQDEHFTELREIYYGRCSRWENSRVELTHRFEPDFSI